MVTTTVQSAIYARVSSGRQTATHTIDSQLEALRARVAGEDGLVSLTPELEFIDDGYSGASFVRPALERLRDLAAAGGVDHLYVHSPDRLARKYAYQVLLVEEFSRAGVKVIFLNHEIGRSPEDDLLLQVQGMIAEYERAKIIERNRRGKRHAALSGSVNVLSGAPYGYRYITRHEGAGGQQARYEILPEEARVVRQIFEWVGRDRLTLREVCRRLTQAKELTRTGRTKWDRSVVWGILKNPAYVGEAAYGKTREEEGDGAMRTMLRAQRGRSLQPRRPSSRVDVPQEEWIAIPVPALVPVDLFALVQEQLRLNQQQARQRQRGARYLLQGLICCRICGYAYYGKCVSSRKGGRCRDYAYYRCPGTDAYRFAGERVCSNLQVRTEVLDLAVWQEVKRLLENPSRLAEEYRRRLQPHSTAQEEEEREMAGVKTQSGKLRQGIARLIDSYAEGLIEKSEFQPRLARLRERVAKLEAEARQMAEQRSLQNELRLIIGRVEEFTSRVKDGLDKADWGSKRDIIRALVKRVEIDKDQVNIVFRVGQLPFEPGPERGSLQHCRGSQVRAPRGTLLLA